MNYFFQIFFGKRPKLKIKIFLLLIHKYAMFGELKAILGHYLISLV